jgi:hypothetical protein
VGGAAGYKTTFTTIDFVVVHLSVMDPESPTPAGQGSSSTTNHLTPHRALESKEAGEQCLARPNERVRNCHTYKSEVAQERRLG